MKRMLTIAVSLAVVIGLTGCTSSEPAPKETTKAPTSTNESLTSAAVKLTYTNYLNDLNAISYEKDIVPIIDPLLADGTMSQEEQDTLVKDLKAKFPTVFGRIYIPTNEENYDSIIFSYYSSYVASLEANNVQKDYEVPTDSIQMNGRVSVVNNETLKITNIKSDAEVQNFLSNETALVYVDNKWQIIPDYIVDSVDLAAFNNINSESANQ
jgi:hypothetical protein